MMDMFVSYLCMQKVETQNLASHKQGCTINGYGYMPAVAAFFPRETQNFASLQADASIELIKKTPNDKI